MTFLSAFLHRKTGKIYLININLQKLFSFTLSQLIQYRKPQTLSWNERTFLWHLPLFYFILNMRVIKSVLGRFLRSKSDIIISNYFRIPQEMNPESLSLFCKSLWKSCLLFFPLFLQCLWCITSKSCITYPYHTILPPSSVCPLNEARWGQCTSTYNTVHFTLHTLITKSVFFKGKPSDTETSDLHVFVCVVLHVFKTIQRQWNVPNATSNVFIHVVRY